MLGKQETDDDSHQPRFVPKNLPEVLSPAEQVATQEAKPTSLELSRISPAPQASIRQDTPSEKAVSPEKSPPVSKMGETDADIDYDDSKVCPARSCLPAIVQS